MSDLIRRADAIDAIDDAIDADSPQWAILRTKIGFLPSADAVEFDFNKHKPRVRNKVHDALPSAETETTVIRSKTLMPTKDFKEWAKRIKEVNPNAVVIPCDAEVASAEDVHGWIPCSKRLPENTAEWNAYITCNEEGNISKTFWADGWNCWRNPDGEINRDYELKNIVAWMPLPEPYKEKNDEEV